MGLRPSGCYTNKKLKPIRWFVLLFRFVAMIASFKLHQIVLKITDSNRKTKHNR